jgi:glycine cleavage system H protein
MNFIEENNMTAQYPENLRYTDTHEYVGLAGQTATNQTATVGITAFAIDQLGDIVFLELPAVGSTVTQGAAFGTVESVKAVEDLKAPVSGKVIKSNQAMVDAPEELVNDPYQAGWLIEIEVSNAAEMENMMTAAEYRSKVEGH